MATFTERLPRPQLTMSRDLAGHLVITFDHPESADDVVLETIESTNLSAWSDAVFESETVPSAGWLRATWHSNATGSPAFLKVRVRLV